LGSEYRSGTGTASGTGKDSGQTGGGKTKPVIAITKKTCKEGTVQDVIRSEYGDKAALADWTQLKQAYGDDLPKALEAAGLENEQAVWVASQGMEYASGNRHFFIQRFDNNRPRNSTRTIR
jgi:hypothetical protein